jgi:flagellar biosynthetic protein FlhB
MAEQDNFERTEEASPKRREEARKKGTIANSRSVIPAATLAAGVLILRFTGPDFLERLGRLIVGYFSLAGSRRELAPEKFISLSFDSGLLMAPVLAPLFMGITLAGVGSGLLQTGFLFTTETLKPNFGRINPLNGLKRVFKPDSAIDLLKALLTVVGLGALGYQFLSGILGRLLALPGLGVEGILVYVGTESMRLTGGAVALMVALAGGDYMFQRWRISKQLRMSRHELKEEFRESEGDPLIKSRLRGLRQKISRRRMMADVAKAAVVVTNPDHIAVALSYDVGEMAAPRVVAKGAGFVAQKIKEIAAEHRIPIIENKPLARLLFKAVEVGQEIHESLYRAVAEILAYVYKLRRAS